MKYVEVTKSRFRAITFSADGRYLVSLHDAGYLRFWELPEFREALTVSLPIIPTHDHRLTLMGQHLVTFDYLFDLGPAWDALAGKGADKPTVSRVELEGIERYSLVGLASLGASHELVGLIPHRISSISQYQLMLRRWDLAGHSLGRWAVYRVGQTDWFWDDLAVSPDSETAVYGAAYDARLVTLSPLFANESPQVTALSHTDHVHRFCFAPTGRQLATAAGRSAWLWDLTGERSPVRFPAFRWSVSRLAFHPHGRQFAATSSAGQVRVYDALRAKELLHLELPTGGEVRGLAYAPDGMTGVAAGRGKQLLVWDIE
jgi:WD40 repeat protein